MTEPSARFRTPVPDRPTSTKAEPMPDLTTDAIHELGNQLREIAALKARVAELTPREITDPAELDALPVGSVIVGDGAARQAIPGGGFEPTPRWVLPGGLTTRSSAEVLGLSRGSVTLVWVPTPAGEGDGPSTGDLGGKAGGSDSSLLARLDALTRPPYGGEYEHDHEILEGHDACPACWAEDIRRALAGGEQ